MNIPNVTEEDLATLREMAIKIGTSNKHAAACCRVALALFDHVAGGLAPGAAQELKLTIPPELLERVDRLEAALRNAELPDVAELEQRLAALEEAISAPKPAPPAPAKKR